MAIRKEYRCEAHGYFESTKPKCPHGCNTVQRVHITPPSVITSGRTANIDKTLDKLAVQYNMTDISNRNGSVASSVPMYQTGGLQAGFATLGSNPMATLQQHGFQGDNAMSRVKSDMALKGPTPAAGSQIDLKSANAFKGS